MRGVPQNAVRLLGAGAAAVILLSACRLQPQQPAQQQPRPAAPPVTVSVAEARLGDLSASLTYTGTVEPKAQVALVPKTGGRVTRLLVDVGSEVKAGDLIAELDHLAIDAQVQQAEAALAAAQARLAALQRGARPEQIAAARAQVEMARAQQAAAQAQLEAVRAQQEAAAANAAAARVRAEQVKAGPRREIIANLESLLETAKIGLEQARASQEQIRLAELGVENARLGLKQAQQGPRPEQIQAAQAGLDQAKAALARLTDGTPLPNAVKSAELNVESALQAVLSLEKQLNERKVANQKLQDQRDAAPSGSPLVPGTKEYYDTQVLPAAKAAEYTLELQLAQARIAVQQAELALANLKGGPDPWTLRQAQLAVEQAQANLNLLKNPDPNAIERAQLGVQTAQVQLDQAKKQVEFAVRMAEERVKQAQLQLDQARTPAEADVQAAEYAAQAAEAQARAAEQQARAAEAQAAQVAAAVQQAEAAAALQSNPYTTEDLRQAMAAVEQARAGLAAAKAAQAEAFIYAPIDGIVAQRHVSVGSTVGPTTPIVTLISPELELTINVEEAKIGLVQPGQQVVLTLPALPGRQFTGRVLTVFPAGDARSRSFTVRIAPDDTGGVLKPGMFVQASITTEQRQQTLVVPREAVVRRNGGQFVFVASGSIAQMRPVQVGLIGDRLVEIVSGIRPGEQVIVVGQESLKDGEAIAIATTDQSQ
jgi:RND family efflux transporter MFP subunit